MIKTLMTNGPALGFLLSVTSLATAASSRRRPRFLPGSDRTVAAGTAPAWLPWVLVGALAVASITFGILYPDAYAVVMNEGFTAP